MGINAYLYFPENEENLFLDNKDFATKSKEMNTFIGLLTNTKNSKSYNEKIDIYYSSENIENFINKAKGLIDEVYLNDPIKQLRILLKNETNINPYSINKISENVRYYFIDYVSFNIQIQESTNYLSEVMERICKYNRQKETFLINFGNRIVHSRNFIPVFKDGLYSTENLPEKFIHINELSENIMIG